jgi:hypothetical protein
MFEKYKAMAELIPVILRLVKSVEDVIPENRKG